MNTILIKNGRVVDPSQNLDEIIDILIENGKIILIEKNIDKKVDEIIDATGLLVTTGFVDMHVHLREPGFEYKEDIISGCESGVAGGITSMVCMPNTKPVIDNAETVEYILKKSKYAKAKVYPAGAITTNLSGTQLTNFQDLKKAGVIALSDDGRPVENAMIMQQALQQAKKQDLLVISHCEDMNIIKNGIINKGEVSEKLGVSGMDRTSEDYITAREIALANGVDSKIHIAHVSTEYATKIIRDAKKQGIKVTAETCPHYFWFTDKKLLLQDADYRMNPPLREEKDVEEIISGIIDGTFDCIVTDHAPHSLEEKQDFLKAPNGVIGMETSFSASYTKLVDTGIITLSRLIELMSLNPSKILGIEGGTLKVGSNADITIIDLNQRWMVDPCNGHSKAKNFIFKGEELKSKVKYTLCNGKIVFKY